MTNPLSKLSLDYWYHVVMVVSVVVFLSVGSGVLSAFPTAPTAIISLGAFFIGLGEWTNHPLQTVLVHGGVMTSHPRSPEPIGNAFDILGFCLVAFGIYRLFF